MQEAVRKDVKRTFGVLQARFAIIANSSRLWGTQDMAMVMRACIILHNMIVQDERDLHTTFDYNTVTTATIGINNNNSATFQLFSAQFNTICDSDVHHCLRNNLMEHLWQQKGQEED